MCLLFGHKPFGLWWLCDNHWNHLISQICLFSDKSLPVSLGDSEELCPFTVVLCAVYSEAPLQVRTPASVSRKAQLSYTMFEGPGTQVAAFISITPHWWKCYKGDFSSKHSLFPLWKEENQVLGNYWLSLSNCCKVSLKRPCNFILNCRIKYC